MKFEQWKKKQSISLLLKGKKKNPLFCITSKICKIGIFSTFGLGYLKNLMWWSKSRSDSSSATKKLCEVTFISSCVIVGKGHNLLFDLLNYLVVYINLYKRSLTLTTPPVSVRKLKSPNIKYGAALTSECKWRSVWRNARRRLRQYTWGNVQIRDDL